MRREWRGTTLDWLGCHSPLRLVFVCTDDRQDGVSQTSLLETAVAPTDASRDALQTARLERVTVRLRKAFIYVRAYPSKWARGTNVPLHGLGDTVKSCESLLEEIAPHAERKEKRSSSAQSHITPSRQILQATSAAT